MRSTRTWPARAFYRRVIQRQRYRRSCECGSAPRTITAPPAARLISGGILGISVWVTV